MRNNYRSTRQYLPIALLLTFLLIGFVASVIYLWQAPYSSAGRRQVIVTYNYGKYQRKEQVNVGYLDEPSIPIREGYSFEGWYCTVDGETVKWDFSKDEVIRDTILTAQWSLIPYKLTLNLNGGICNKDFIFFYVDHPLNLPIPTKKGYYFAGWYKNGYQVENKIWCHPYQDDSVEAAWVTYPPDTFVKLGYFEQDGDPETKNETPIEWEIIDYRDGKYLLISKYILCCRTNEKVNNWSESELREWLNSEFLQDAFSEEERQYIAETYLEDVKTTDRVFILNSDEAKKLILNEESFHGIPTAYAKKQGLDAHGASTGEILYSYWWSVRDVGKNFIFIASKRGTSGSSTSGISGVRPAMWVSEEVLMDIVKTSE